MGKNKEIGIKGEVIAVNYLKQAGYRIRKTNYTFRRKEIDIITEKEGILVFFEVKTRQGSRFGMPEEAVDNKKIDHILRCANHYIQHTGWNGPIRFDILSIMLYPEVSINHIRDAFF